MPPVALEVGAGVVRVLADEHCVGSGGERGLSDGPREHAPDVDVAVAPGHVRDVEAPPVELEGGSQPAADDIVEPPPELLRAVVELRQRAHTRPRGVAVLEPVVEPEEVSLRRAGVAERAREPLVVVADVVDREVTDDPDPARVRCVREGHERLVAAEQRIDLVERRGVVAVRRARPEERRQVEDRRPKELEVVEVRLDAGEIAAEPLERRRRPPAGRSLVPRARHGPLRRVPLDPGAREAVGEDLIDDAVAVPGRPVVAKGADEVVGVRDVVADDGLAGHPRVAERTAGDEPPVRHRRVEGRERRAPPRLALRLLVDGGDGNARLAVADVANGDGVRGRCARHAEADRDGVAELLRRLDDVRLRAVVVRERERSAGHHPFTAPWVRPPTIQRWRTMKISTTGSAARTTPAQNGPHSWPNWSEMKP